MNKKKHVKQTVKQKQKWGDRKRNKKTFKKMGGGLTKQTKKLDKQKTTKKNYQKNGGGNKRTQK